MHVVHLVYNSIPQAKKWIDVKGIADIKGECYSPFRALINFMDQKFTYIFLLKFIIRQQNINTKDGKSKYRIQLHDKSYRGPGAPIAITTVQAELDVSILQNSFAY